jgi:glycosyltransferase involved in cell wall biosynthesis
MKVTISVPGKFEPAYLAGRYLESRGELERVITPVPYSRVKRFGVSHRRTTSLTPIGAWNYGVQRFGPRVAQQPNQIAVSVAFDAAASRMLGACDLFNGWSSTSLLTIRAARRRGIPAVLTVGSAHAVTQNALLEEEQRRFGPNASLAHPRLIERMVAEYEEADAIVAPSRWVVQSFLDHGVPASKLHRVPWGVIPVTGPVDRRGRTGRPRILFVGGCSQRKGVPYLLDAFRRLQGEATLRLVGSPDVELFRRAGGLPPACEAVGAKTTPELAAEYDAADIFVLPSVEDGSALATILAMAAGLPVIVSDQAGADLVVDGVNGFIVPARDASALAARMEQLIANPELRARMGAAAAASAVTRTWETYGRELYGGVYAPVLAVAHTGKLAKEHHARAA